jgi:glycine/D-amino acid oxidase-like deaminating enzyme
MRTSRLPHDDSPCGWNALLPALPPAQPLRGAERADCAIIGAGFTGLAVARQLAVRRPEWHTVVLEAQRVGDGASGRNSGFVLDLAHVDMARGLDTNQRLLRLGRAGRAHLRALVETQAIECGWSEGGRLHGAAGRVGADALEHFLAGLDALGESYERLDGAALSAIIGSTYYRVGARTRAAATVQPAALIRGLARTLPASVSLCESSPVRAVAGEGPFAIRTDGGVLTAANLVLATNGYTPAIGALQRRILPLMTFASLSRPLTDAESAALGGEPEWGLVSEARMGTTLRRLRSGRLLIRNTVRYAPRLGVGAALYRRVRARHRRDLAARFPTLAAVEFEYTWGGVMGASFNAAQFFGALAPNLYAAAGYNGVGLAMGTISGVLLADLIAGAESPLLADMQALPAPSRMPPGAMLGVGVRALLAWMGRTARGE